MSPKKLLRVRVKNIKKKVKVAAESTAKNAKGPGPYSELRKSQNSNSTVKYEPKATVGNIELSGNPDLSLTVFDEPEATDGNVEYCEKPDFESTLRENPESSSIKNSANPDLSLTVFDEPEATDGNVEYCENDFEDSGSNYSDNKSESESDDEFLQSFKNNEKKRSSFGKIQRKRWTAEEINALTIEFGEPAQILKLPYLKKMHRGNQQESPS
ncbi:uncharacterized protein [Drosophila takahashii]|uniref:uncharacterized protein isoform X2 n=1 Tax=Drosophila takahashii TaxID=29030 RepID=UPI003899225A